MKLLSVVFVSLLCIVPSFGAEPPPTGYELEFYLTFYGRTTNVSANGTGTNYAKSQSQQSQTLIDNTFGIIYSERALIGPTALWVTDFDRTQSGSITEWGNITFAGDGSPHSPTHVINLNLLQVSLYEGWHGYLHSTGYYNVTGGVGAFQSAEGLLAFTTSTNQTDTSYLSHVSGSLWIPQAPPTPRPSLHRS